MGALEIRKGIPEKLRSSYQFCRLIEDLLCSSNGCLALLAARFRDLVELLVQVGLDQLQLALIAGKHLRARVSVKRVRHLREFVP